MRAPLDIDALFPIKDEASAWLMSLKAECLLRAGIITEGDRQVVEARAAQARRKLAA
jgi:hypothetical protein